MIAESVTGLIGNTPLAELKKIGDARSCRARILAKCEFKNPGGSIKDRTALYLIRGAMERGELRPGGVIIEATSGNTGVGLAMLAPAFGCRVMLTMPESMSLERRKLLSAYGAELVLTPAGEGMSGAVERAGQLHASIPGSILARQFESPDNARAHFETTGPEIWRDTSGRVDALVAVFGTGGTVSGVGRYLKRQAPGVRVIAVEPAESPLLTQGHAGAHGIQGIGANFIPQALEREVLDQVLSVSTPDAMAMTRALARTEGLLCGISSGAAVEAACRVAAEPRWAGKTIVTILPDTGERYLSSGVFDGDF